MLFYRVDNGTMLLDHVEIPHVNFLAGYASVDPDTGKFNRPQHDKLAYGTMVYIRASECKSCSYSSRNAIAD